MALTCGAAGRCSDSGVSYRKAAPWALTAMAGNTGWSYVARVHSPESESECRKKTFGRMKGKQKGKEIAKQMGERVKKKKTK